MFKGLKKMRMAEFESTTFGTGVHCAPIAPHPHCGIGGYRTPCLAHAKRALYHLSYYPICICRGLNTGLSGHETDTLPPELHMHLLNLILNTDHFFILKFISVV